MRKVLFKRKAMASRRGAVLVEAVIVVWILILLTFGLVECGHFFFVQHNIAGAAREGARRAIVAGSNNGEVTTAINNVLQAANYPPGQFTVNINPTNVATVPPGSSITVTVSTTWGAVGIRPLGLLNAGMQVQSVAVMQKE